MSTKNRPKRKSRQKCKQQNVPIKISEEVIIVLTPTGSIIINTIFYILLVINIGTYY